MSFGFGFSFGTREDKDGNVHYYINDQEVTREEYDLFLKKYQSENPLGEFLKELDPRAYKSRFLNLKPRTRAGNLEMGLDQTRPCDVIEMEDGKLLCMIADSNQKEYNQIKKGGKIHYKDGVLTISGVNFNVDIKEEYLPLKEKLHLNKIKIKYQNRTLELNIPIK